MAHAARRVARNFGVARATDTIATAMGLIVQKFGGTSLADAEKIHRAARRAIRAKLENRKVVLVVSAMGQTTDELIDLARAVSSDPPKRELDMLLTTGEQVSIALMAMAIDSCGHEAISLTAGQLGLVSDSAHTRARIQRISRDRIDRELEAGKIVIVAGFQGVDAAGEITTLGRGSSDTTAAALATVLGAETCEIYTDVDGVYTADPRRVPQARKIDRVSYDVMLEMAAAGAAVMHSRAVEFGKKYHVPIHVRSSFTDTAGTMIMAETAGMEAVAVQGVTLREDLAMVSLTAVPNTPGMAARIFAEVARNHILVDDIVQNIYDGGRLANLAFSTHASDAGEARRVCERLAGETGFGGVAVDEGVSKVSAIGVGMRSHTGIASTMFEALSRAAINIENISTSEIVISVIVRREDGTSALRCLHEAFELDKGPSNNHVESEAVRGV
jgi:aspartate kinase